MGLMESRLYNNDARLKCRNKTPSKNYWQPEWFTYFLSKRSGTPLNLQNVSFRIFSCIHIKFHWLGFDRILKKCIILKFVWSNFIWPGSFWYHYNSTYQHLISVTQKANEVNLPGVEAEKLSIYFYSGMQFRLHDVIKYGPLLMSFLKWQQGIVLRLYMNLASHKSVHFIK